MTQQRYKTIRLFLSHSGSRGHRVAEALKTALLDFGGDAIECFLSPGDIGPGDPWFNEIDRQLESCSACIVVLDSGHWKSLWMPYELKAFTSDNNQVFPLRIGIGAEEVKGPFLSLQTRPLDKSSLREVFDFVAERSDAVLPPVAESVRSSWNDIKAVVDDVLDKVVPYEELVAHLRRSASETGRGLQVSQEQLKSLDSYLETLQYAQLSGTLTSLGEDMRRLLEQSLDAEEWNLIWRVYGSEFLADAARLIHSLAKGRLVLRGSDRSREFWREWIMEYTRESIWTTNVKGTNGRSKSRDLLSRQEALLNDPRKNVSITRVFIFDPNDEPDMNDVRHVMKEQLQIGIVVRSMTLEQFGWRVNAARVADVGSPDFMIIDDEYLYVTLTQDGRLGGIEFRANSDEIRLARRIRDDIQGAADVITLDNVDRFPDAW